MSHSPRTALAVLLSFGLLAAACGGSDSADDTASDDTATDAATDETTDDTSGDAESTDAASDGEAAGLEVDTNGDGKVVIGVATPGPRNDGAYYEALVTGIEEISAANGFDEPIIVDNIKEEEAATQLDSLARQGVDIIAVGDSVIGDPLVELTETYADILWYCNCGSGFTELPNLIQQRDDGNEIQYITGVAAGLLMQEAGVTKAGMIGNNNLNFEQQTFQAFQLGLESVDPSFEWTYVPTGSFNDVAAATEAYNNLTAQGVGMIYPYLGGAHEAVVQLANADGVIVTSSGASNACERSDVAYDMESQFDAGDYAGEMFEKIIAGDVQRGETYVFHVGVDESPGAEICDPTPEQQEALDAAFALVASGDLQEPFDAITEAVYGG